MVAEIVFPRDNESEFAEIGAKLGIKKLYFFYDFDEYNRERTEKKLSMLQNHNNIQLNTGFLVNHKNMSKAFGESKMIAVKSSDKDRLFIESNKVKLIYGFEDVQKKDYLHQRASGLNHTLCDLAKEHNVAICFSYASLFNKSDRTAAMLIGRMMQNIKLCRKYKVKTTIGSFSERPFDLRSHYDVASLFLTLGMDSDSIKESMARGF